MTNHCFVEFESFLEKRYIKTILLLDAVKKLLLSNPILQCARQVSTILSLISYVNGVIFSSNKGILTFFVTPVGECLVNSSNRDQWTVSVLT